MKRFNGKAIYQPKPAAAEFSKYICRFYYGCTCGCTYCAHRRWGWNTVKLNAHFKDESHALELFEKELRANLQELQKHGLMFCISTDPMLDEVWEKTFDAVDLCVKDKIPVKTLTKKADWVEDFLYAEECTFYLKFWKRYVAFGFTLTGHDELEPNASPNAERIEAMRQLHEAGFKTWSSIEPVIDFSSAIDMIVRTMEFCDLYKIGLLSGKKYDAQTLKTFVRFVCAMQPKRKTMRIYFKDSLLRQAGIERERLPANCVDRDYNMFYEK